MLNKEKIKEAIEKAIKQALSDDSNIEGATLVEVDENKNIIVTEHLMTVELQNVRKNKVIFTKRNFMGTKHKPNQIKKAIENIDELVELAIARY